MNQQETPLQQQIKIALTDYILRNHIRNYNQFIAHVMTMISPECLNIAIKYATYFKILCDGRNPQIPYANTTYRHLEYDAFVCLLDTSMEVYDTIIYYQVQLNGEKSKITLIEASKWEANKHLNTENSKAFYEEGLRNFIEDISYMFHVKDDDDNHMFCNETQAEEIKGFLMHPENIQHHCYGKSFVFKEFDFGKDAIIQ